MSAKRTARRAFTLVETLISLSIVAGLMVAMAGGFVAASSAVEMNDRFFRSVQQARAAENLIMTEVRRSATQVFNSSTSIILTPPAGDTDFGGVSIAIAYNPPSGSTPGNITINGTPLAANVSSATFSKSVSPTTGLITGISLTMTVQIGENQITLSDSAAPRANLTSLYQ